MLYSIKQGFLNGESISQDVIIYGGNGQQTKYNIYEREINEVIGKPQIGQVNKNDPTFWSATGNFFGGIGGSVVDTVTGIGNMIFHPIQTAQGIGNAFAHPIVTGEAIWDTVSTSFVNDVINGDANTRSRFAGRAIGEIGLAIIGTKGLDKVSKVDKVVDATRAVKATMGRISDDVVRVLSNEGDYIRLGRAAEETVNSKYTYNMIENPGPLAEINQGVLLRLEVECIMQQNSRVIQFSIVQEKRVEVRML